MKPPYRVFRFDWLIDPSHEPTELSPEDGDVEWLPYPIPHILGEGGFQKVDLGLNMSVFRGVHRFTPAAAGQLIPLADVAVDFPETTFMAQVLRGGRILHREKRPLTEVLYSPGLDLFRLTDQLNLVPVLDGSENSEMTCLTVGTSMLSQLIGEDQAELLLNALGLSSCPALSVRRLPLHVSAHLHGAIGTSWTGAARRLFCQARMLNYLGALIDEVMPPEMRPKKSGVHKDRSRQVHDYLQSKTGRLVTLDELAQQFGCSSKRLNDEFSSEYGQSLYTFITSQRMQEAHAALQQTDVPIKKLAEQLGYAHVSNFSIAFKRRFGYPPGSLRH
jgi:AraC-like DNA-binding protein